MPKLGTASLSGLENKVMRIVWQQGQATAEAVRATLAESDQLKDSTVRTILRRLEQKGYVTHQTAGRSYVYSPTVAQRNVAADAVRGIIQRLMQRLGRRLADGHGRSRGCFARKPCSNWPSGLPKTKKPPSATGNVQERRSDQERDSAMASYVATTTELLVDITAERTTGHSGRNPAALLASSQR